jgi:hypothetical protein
MALGVTLGMLKAMFFRMRIKPFGKFSRSSRSSLQLVEENSTKEF